MMTTTASRNHPFHIIFLLSSSTKGKTPPGEQPFPALPPPKAAMLPAQPVVSKQLPKKASPQTAAHLSATAPSPFGPTGKSKAPLRGIPRLLLPIPAPKLPESLCKETNGYKCACKAEEAAAPISPAWADRMQQQDLSASPGRRSRAGITAANPLCPPLQSILLKALYKWEIIQRFG